ncbi:MAG: sigma-54-dependent Fis family transcriptional regulator [Candidatus Tectomicrobia bacterium]|uniref:Sigma-54-dependent Fis family transcriptional regulator n=1 Tax=Tectimicrobiota bacterium TaxID=2528274 RepID=A0A932MPR1_UNCTE|nr:sigma-54-dependent Fis family transcriptional regulator [Candidatus Tectomicrobia bacterium]
MNTPETAPAGKARPAVIHVVEDDPRDLSLVELLLRREGFTVLGFSDAESFLAHAAKQSPDVILLDLLLPGIGGLETLSRLNQLQLEAPVILLTGQGTAENAFQAMRLGAYDFIPKPFEAGRLSVSIHNALRTKDLTREVRKLQDELRIQFDFRNLIGVSPAITRVLASIERLAGSDLPVLIQGEAGTGKELVGRTIHYNSRRGEGPFVYLNCGDLRPDLVSAELFGGSSPSGVRRPGKWDRANGGTLFLDDVSELPAPLQDALLRQLEREKEPGATAMDIRIICAARKDLAQEVEAGRFSPELVNRLAPFRVVMPPLRERLEDIPLLAQRILNEIALQEHRPERVLSPEAMETLENYPWPGNIRELKNVLRQVCSLSSAPVLRAEDLPPSIREAAAKRAEAEPAPEAEPISPIKEVEERLIRQSLAQTGWDVNRSASLLGISRATLYRRLKALQISRENL